ncbi:MAG: sulfite exporter TauE/SafE family protein, partial [Cyanobium sp.]
VGEPVELTVFALAALTASWLMTRQATASRERQPAVEAIVEPAWSGRRLLLSLPAQGVLVGLPMQLAGCTSLLLIAVNALVAFSALGHWPA